MTDEINVDCDSYQITEAYQEACDICLKSFDTEPKIRCADCITTTLICMQCFSLGLETKTHRCDHSYHIDRRHIPLDPDTDWSLQEDFDLLQSVLECGYGNYMGLNKRFTHRTFEEIRKRIDELLGLDKAPLRTCLQVGPRVVLPYNAETTKLEPPRFPHRSVYSKQFAGYCAPRGDFESEYCNNAEDMLKNLDVDSDSDDEEEDVKDGLPEQLACALVECYNEKLKERVLRKNAVKNYGLLTKKTFSVSTWNDPKLTVFARLLETEDFELLAEGITMEIRLKNKMRRLRKYRNLGITRLRSCEFYDKLEAMRSSESKDLQKTVQMLSKPVPSLIRKTTKVTPIDISQFEGYERLTPSERALCSTIRILPEKFQLFKSNLIQINRQEGGVRLMAARSSLKIDVNKTRQIYNFLRDEGLINAI